MSVQSSLVMYPIYAYGSEEQRKKYLPKLATGEWIGCFGLTEPDAGSDPGGMRTRAEKIDGGYRLNGAKMWITNRRSPTSRGLGQVRRRMAARSAASSSSAARRASRRPRSKASCRCAPPSPARSCMDGVEVGEDALLPNVAGLKGPFGCLNRARYGIAWGAMGAANSACTRPRNIRSTASSSAGRSPRRSSSR